MKKVNDAIKIVEKFQSDISDTPHGVCGVIVVSNSRKNKHLLFGTYYHGKHYEGSNPHMSYGAVLAIKRRFFEKNAFESFRDKILRWAMNFWLRGQNLYECEREIKTGDKHE